jgi:redox-sensitive bicupin YhaK (pirin superfamily)
MPRAKGADTVRTLYLFDGGGLVIDGAEVAARTGAVVRADADLELESPDGTDVLVLQGRPIGEPVARYGPFVMNEEHEIEQAFADYRETQFGGWPWPTEEPVHRHAQGRFARRPDGTVEEPAEV